MILYYVANLSLNDVVLAIKSSHPGIVTALIFLLLVFALAFTAYILVVRKRRKATKKSDLSLANLKLSSKDYYTYTKNAYFTRMSKSSKLEELNKDLEPFGFAYYPKQDIFYSIMNGWQRDYGYCELYDEGAATFSMIIDCEPIRFEYAGKKWLIEFWKGQYGLNTGCEIGIYSTKGPNLNIPGFFDGTFYFSASDEDHLPLSFTLKKNGGFLFTRSEKHWWLTGFRLGEFSYPSELTMDVDITLRDEDMRDAFIEGFREAGYSDNEFTVLGNTVHFQFITPHSPQPITREPLTELMQANNQRNCEAYRFATRYFYNPLDKLGLVKMQAPKMYRKILNIGDNKNLFNSYNIIKKFLNFDKSDDE
jgi:hypothetical protein